VPSPAFNQEPHRNEVSPLQNRQLPELDDSYVALIFHTQRANRTNIMGLTLNQYGWNERW